jgi:hypothetical protein
MILDGQDITDAGARIIGENSEFAELRRLDLGGCPRLTANGIQALLASSQLTRLESLSLSGEIDLTRLAQSPRLGQLRRLMLAERRPFGFVVPSAEPWAALADSPYLGRLRNLGLAYRTIPGDAIARLLSAPGLRNLHTLAIWDAHGIGDRVLSQLAGTVPQGPALTSLDLVNCGVTNQGVRVLAASPFLSGLGRLRLAWNDGSPVCIEELLASSYLSPRLHRLDLSGWQLSREAFSLLASNPRLSGLRHLTLRSTGLDAEGMAALLASPYLRRLTALHLGSEQSTEALLLLARSTGLPRLRELVLGSRANAQAIAALRQRFGPRLIVYTDE